MPVPVSKSELSFFQMEQDRCSERGPPFVFSDIYIYISLMYISVTVSRWYFALTSVYASANLLLLIQSTWQMLMCFFVVTSGSQVYYYSTSCNTNSRSLRFTVPCCQFDPPIYIIKFRVREADATSVQVVKPSDLFHSLYIEADAWLLNEMIHVYFFKHVKSV